MIRPARSVGTAGTDWISSTLALLQAFTALVLKALMEAPRIGTRHQVCPWTTNGRLVVLSAGRLPILAKGVPVILRTVKSVTHWSKASVAVHFFVVICCHSARLVTS